MKELQASSMKRLSQNIKNNDVFPAMGGLNNYANASYLYTPAQHLISNFLTTKKNIEDSLISTLKGISQMKSNNQLSILQLSDQLSLKKKQLLSIKRKLNKSCQQQLEIYDVMKKRINRHQKPSFKKHTPQSSKDIINSNKFAKNTENQSTLVSSFSSPIKKVQQNINKNQPLTYQAGQYSNQLTKKKQEQMKLIRGQTYEEFQQQIELNKQIAFFMLQNSMKFQDQIIKKQNKIKLRQIQLKQKQKVKLKLQQDENMRIQNQLRQNTLPQQYGKINHLNEFQNDNNNKNDMGMQQQIIQQLQRNEDMVPNIRILQNQYRVIEYQQEHVQQDSIQHNMFSQVYQLQRFFQMQDIQLQSIQIPPLKGKSHNLSQIIKQLSQQAQIANSQQIDEYQNLQKNNIFSQSEFIKSLQQQFDKEQQKLQPMQIESQNQQNNHHSLLLQNNNHSLPLSSINGQLQQKDKKHKQFLYFEGQIQLQCMLFRKKQQISQDIRSNQLASIDRFLYENSHMIKKYDSNIQFWLILCKAIQLIKSKNIHQQMQAIEIIRNKIDKMNNQLEVWHKQELEKVTSMLLYEQKVINNKQYLQKVQQSFRIVFQQIYRLPDMNQFLHRIYTGALVLKTPTCCEKDKQNPLICPLCNPLAEKVFQHIPVLTKNQSNLICRISGSVMDHQNYPIMLPSNQIYSLNGLQSTKNIVRGNGGKFYEQYYCKFTQTWYCKDQAKKVYLA